MGKTFRNTATDRSVMRNARNELSDVEAERELQAAWVRYELARAEHFDTIGSRDALFDESSR